MMINSFNQAKPVIGFKGVKIRNIREEGGNKKIDLTLTNDNDPKKPANNDAWRAQRYYSIGLEGDKTSNITLTLARNTIYVYDKAKPSTDTLGSPPPELTATFLRDMLGKAEVKRNERQIVNAARRTLNNIVNAYDD